MKTLNSEHPETSINAEQNEQADCLVLYFGYTIIRIVGQTINLQKFSIRVG